MPVREDVVRRVTEALVGTQTWNGLNGQCHTMPTEDYGAVHEMVDSIFVRFIESIDWKRIMLEAVGRHISLEHDDDDSDYSDSDFCQECLIEALLALDRGGYRDWAKDPAAPREKGKPLPYGHGEDSPKDTAVRLAIELGQDGTAW